MSEDHNESLKIITPENSYSGILHVPTKSDGATISQSGWVIGNGTISRTTSKGSVEEEEYKDIVSKLIVHDSHIELGVMLRSDLPFHIGVNGENAGTPERTIRVDLPEVTDVRQGEIGVPPSVGLIFETSEDVYQIKLFNHDQNQDKGLLRRIFSNDMANNDELIRQSVERIQASPGKSESTGGNPGDESVGEELERVKELYERDMLSEEEFQKAKKRILE